MKWKGSSLLAALSIILLLLQGSQVYADELPVASTADVKITEQERADKLRQLEEATELLYQDMQQGNTQRANQDMEQVIEALERLSFKGLTSVEGIHALAESIMDVKETLAKAVDGQEEWISSSARLRLAVNSLTHPKQAMWHQYYKVLGEDLQRMNQAHNTGSGEALRQAYLSLKSHYELIRPAVVIRKDITEINRFDSWLYYVDSLTNDTKADTSVLTRTLLQGEALVKELFGKKGDEQVFLPIAGYGNPWNWSLLIGGWILLALFYTAYRKYRANQTVITIPGNKEKNDRFRF
ncbi:sporulation protein YpjB [Paenibacillus sp. D2_2]|nr:sporulation protein YpjB [Paenibacillus sp. D2_2]WMT42712.1 sporulation protein YpjB [Paenibacillus sp. D2_2]